MRGLGHHTNLTPLLLALVLCCAPTVHAARLAIVVDDMGYSMRQSQRVLALPGPIALAILPFAPRAQAIARQASTAGKEVLVHQPMQALGRSHNHPDSGTLTLDMPAGRFVDLLAQAIDRLPTAVGVNNHAGSLLTQHAEPMNRLMAQLDARGLFFVDSRTTHKTVAVEVAHQWHVPVVQRDVFLDHVRTPVAVKNEFERALGIARRNGHALLIAHPNDLSLDFLEAALTRLPADVRLVGVSALLPKPDLAGFGPRENPAFQRISLAR
ncbi:MAG: hypothetical protein CMQ49_09470 [Gammaproteobacteria bacterium]|nr:hypothetical protein [Gammaproteobacteria bacterium]